MVSPPARSRPTRPAPRPAAAGPGLLARLLASHLALWLGACGAPTEPPPEPLPPTGLTPALEVFLFGSSDRCRAASDCPTGACLFGACAGIITVDEPQLVAVVGQRLRAHIEVRPDRDAVNERLIAILGAMLADDESGPSFRARAARALGELAHPLALATLAEQLAPAPSALAELIATLLAERGRADGLDLVLELANAESPSRLAYALSALSALGGLEHTKLPADRRDAVLGTLLSTLSPDIGLELNRAAIRGLTGLGDPRAILPLRRFLVAGPESLADETAAALRRLTNPEQRPDAPTAALGTDPRRWDAWLDEHPAPAPPPFTPRAHRSEDDLDLPTP